MERYAVDVSEYGLGRSFIVVVVPWCWMPFSRSRTRLTLPFLLEDRAVRVFAVRVP